MLGTGLLMLAFFGFMMSTLGPALYHLLDLADIHTKSGHGGLSLTTVLDGMLEVRL